MFSTAPFNKRGADIWILAGLAVGDKRATPSPLQTKQTINLDQRQ